jgi:hypothetical protein
MTKLRLGKERTSADKSTAPALTESALQGKLGVRDDILLKKVDTKIETAIQQYEEKIAAQAQPRLTTKTHIQQASDLIEISKVQNAIKTLNTKVQSIADLEPLSWKPTKIV